ncbi:MAG: hypothetical protein SFU56_11055 [Capsulimonadales bacterium]|nr:hypothetical protein [Capsulimonadales bacterium]
METLINRWRGGRVKIWEYTVSHRVLTLRVEREGSKGNLHISCADLSFLCGPTGWDGANFEIEKVNADSVYEDTVILRDRAVGFEARGGKVEVAENCKPIF